MNKTRGNPTKGFVVAGGGIVLCFCFFIIDKLDAYNILVFYKGKYWYFTTDSVHHRQLIFEFGKFGKYSVGKMTE